MEMILSTGREGLGEGASQEARCAEDAGEVWSVHLRSSIRVEVGEGPDAKMRVCEEASQVQLVGVEGEGVESARCWRLRRFLILRVLKIDYASV